MADAGRRVEAEPRRRRPAGLRARLLPGFLKASVWVRGRVSAL